MLRTLTNFSPEKVCNCIPYQDTYLANYKFTVNTVGGTGCVLFAKFEDNFGEHFSTDNGNEYSGYVASGVKPYYGDDEMTLYIGNVCESDLDTLYKTHIILYQGDPQIVSQIRVGERVSLAQDNYSNGLILCDNKLCAGRIYAWDSDYSGAKYGFYISSGINNIRAPVYAQSDYHTYIAGCAEFRMGVFKTYIEKYEPETGKIKLHNPLPNNVNIGDKYEIYTSYISEPAHAFMLRKYIESPVTPYAKVTNGKIILGGSYSGTPLKYYRWTAGKYDSGMIYSYNKNLEYTLNSPESSAAIETCTTEDQTNSDRIDLPFEETDGKVLKSISMANRRYYVWVQFSRSEEVSENLGQDNSIAVYAVDRFGNQRLVSYNSGWFYDFGAPNGEPLRYCFKAYPANTNVNAAIPIMTEYSDWFTPRFAGITLQELKYIGSHKYNVPYKGKSISFVTADSNSDITSVFGINVYENSAQPLVARTDKDYEQGSYTADLMTFENGEIIDDTERIRLWKDILNSDSPFLLKTPKGECFIVAITDGGSRSYDNETLLTKVNFQWKEIDKFDLCEIIRGW